MGRPTCDAYAIPGRSLACDRDVGRKEMNRTLEANDAGSAKRNRSRSRRFTRFAKTSRTGVRKVRHHKHHSATSAKTMTPGALRSWKRRNVGLRKIRGE